MKAISVVGLVLSLLVCDVRGSAEPAAVSELSLGGEIEGENIVFTLRFTADVKSRHVTIPLVIGDVAHLGGDLPRKADLTRDGDRLLLEFGRAGKQEVELRFASRALKEADWRRTEFTIPVASVRRLSVACDRDDLEVKFPGALSSRRGKDERGRTEVTAFLGITNRFEVRWKPEVRKLHADLVVACSANTIATANVGALRIDTVFSYRVIQGALKEVAIDLPEVSVTQVLGEDIQDWRIETVEAGGRRLLVSLSRTKEDSYGLQVVSEMILPEFPCGFELPVLSPRDVMRTSGFIVMGTDSAIKLNIDRVGGLTQVDQDAFPVVKLGQEKGTARHVPARSVYAYQYAGVPYTLELRASDIVSSLTADSRLSLTLRENELSLNASVELTVKDAPAREIMIEIDPDTAWTVTSTTGKYISEADVDIRIVGEKRYLYIPFKAAVEDVALINIKMERSLQATSDSFDAPRFAVQAVRAERGYLVLAAEEGIRLTPAAVAGVRDVHTGSAPIRVQGAQHAYRFKSGEWQVAMNVQRRVSSIHSEVFHLFSFGEGVMYVSAAITYHISGAPVQEFTVSVPLEIEGVEFTGADIEGWTRDGELCNVKLQTRIMGDYTLLVTYDRQFAYEGATIPLGNIETVGTSGEVGYIALASSASLRIAESEPLMDSIFLIDRHEIPKAYSAPVTDPILRAYKYTRRPHKASVSVTPYGTERLLGQVSDYLELKTVLSKDGEAVTTASFFLKNASRQYLVLRLPEKAELWSISRVEADGTMHDLPSQESEKGILVPVSRPRDPNVALRIRVVYAESHGELGFWRSGIERVKLLGPSLTETHTTFVNWSVDVPDGFAIAGHSGNLSPARMAGSEKRASVFSRSLAVVRAIGDGWKGSTLAAAMTGSWGEGRRGEFCRTIALLDDEAMTLDLSVVPRWIGEAGYPRLMLAGLACGAVILTTGLIAGRKAFLMALGLTSVCLGTAQAAVGRNILGFALVLLLFGLLAVFMSRWGVRWIWLSLCWLMRHLFDVLRFGSVQAGSGCKAAWHGMKRLCRAISKAHAEARGRRMVFDSSLCPETGGFPFEPVGDTGHRPVTPDADSDVTPGGKGPGPVLGLLLVTCLLAEVAFAGFLRSGPDQHTQPPVPPVMSTVDIAVLAPSEGRDIERSAKVDTLLGFMVDYPVSFTVVPPSSVLTDFELNSKDLGINSSTNGYRLVVERGGEYQVKLVSQVPVMEENGNWHMALAIPENMLNNVTLTIPGTDLDVESSDAVLFRTRVDGSNTVAEAVFGPGCKAEFSWRPRVRTTKIEEAVFSAVVDSLAALREGVVDISNLIGYQIAQGEIKALTVRIPEGMGVTAVGAPGLATWRFDPENMLLEALLEKAVTGQFKLSVSTQVACEGLPYAASIKPLVVLGSTRQRGSLGLAAPDIVQVKVEKAEGLYPMNIEDFSKAALSQAKGAAGRPGSELSVRRAFRYHKADDAVALAQTERVLPEIRVAEAAKLSIGDERILLTTRLELLVAKAGVFSVNLKMPDEFDVETLTGTDVAHWDEVMETGRVVTVHFSRRITDSTDINLVVARSEKRIEDRLSVPRVSVAGARKHSGQLQIVGERGVRMMVENHRGVDVKKASEVGIRQPGVLVFNILRPAWSVMLRTEVMAPVVKPEVLQWVDLTEGMLQCRAYFRCQIENAGIKAIQILSPQPGINLTVSGRNIARVHETDKEKGIWQVDLDSKVENIFTMTASYQVPYDTTGKRAKILPLRTVGTEAQRGYLVVTCAGRVQVNPMGDLSGLKVEDPRNIPGSFGAGDLSSAILCYRTIRRDYELDLSVIRHDSAHVLPADIESVTMTSVISTGRKSLNKVAMRMKVGMLRFLKVRLPGDTDRLWTALVNGKEVSVSRDGELYCIPVEAEEGGHGTVVDFIYSGSAIGSALARKQEYAVPKFPGLPLREITWELFARPDHRYYGFEGSMEDVEVPAEDRMYYFGSESYTAWNERRRQESLERAKTVLSVGEQFARAGEQKKAKRALLEALNYSQGQADLNEDARVQFRNLIKQQVKVGLVNRRDALRVSKNIVDDQQVQQMQGFRDGEYTQEYAASVESRLSEKDRVALEVVADKMVDQQAAAAGVVAAINVTMPQHGRSLRFYRALQIDPDGDLSVIFKSTDDRVLKLVRGMVPFAGLFVALWVGLSVTGRHHGTKAV